MGEQADEIMHRVRGMLLGIEYPKREMDCLSGCSRCGRRIVADGKPISGAQLVYPPSTAASHSPKPFCDECMRTAPQECASILSSG